MTIDNLIMLLLHAALFSIFYIWGERVGKQRGIEEAVEIFLSLQPTKNERKDQ